MFVDRLALSVASDDPHWVSELADQTATVYRRRKVPLDDVIRLFEGLRASVRMVLTAEEVAPADTAIDEGIAVFRWHRRLVRRRAQAQPDPRRAVQGRVGTR